MVYSHTVSGIPSAAYLVNVKFAHVGLFLPASPAPKVGVPAELSYSDDPKPVTGRVRKPVLPGVRNVKKPVDVAASFVTSPVFYQLHAYRRIISTGTFPGSAKARCDRTFCATVSLASCRHAVRSLGRVVEGFSGARTMRAFVPLVQHRDVPLQFVLCNAGPVPCCSVRPWMQLSLISLLSIDCTTVAPPNTLHH